VLVRRRAGPVGILKNFFVTNVTCQHAAGLCDAACMSILTPDYIEKDSIPLLLKRCSKITDPQEAVDKAAKLHGEWSSFLRTEPRSLKEKQKRDSLLLSWKKRAKAFLKTVE